MNSERDVNSLVNRGSVITCISSEEGWMDYGEERGRLTVRLGHPLNDDALSVPSSQSVS